MADLDLAAKSNTARDELIDTVMKGLQLSGNASTNIYVISYRDANPEQARKVVQALLTIFVESNLGDKRIDTRTAVKFVDEQIKQYEMTLKNTESRLKDFKLKYMGVAGQGNQDYFAKLAALNNSINAAKLDLRSAEESRDSYKRELAGEAPVLLPEGPAAPVAVPEIDARLATLKAQLDSLLRQYTDEHPDVIGTQRIIEQLEEQRRQYIQSRTKNSSKSGAPGEGAMSRNPVFQQLRVTSGESQLLSGAVRSAQGRSATRASGRSRVRSDQSRLRHPEEDLRDAVAASTIRGDR
jgi:polysaccharide chain length determinant protein (PEP-CTERM system associated)